MSTCSSQEIELDACNDGKIRAVTLYPYQADVTRDFHLQLQPETTRIKISGFPTSFDAARLSVQVAEGVTLSDVKVVWAQSNRETDWKKIDELELKKSLHEKSLTRCKGMVASLDDYVKTALKTGSGINPLEMKHFLDSYDEAGAKWDSKVASLEKEIQELADQIEDEENPSDNPSDPSDAPKSSRASVTFTLIPEKGESLNIKITYGVSNVSWYSAYDIYATSDNSQAVLVVHKGFVRNYSGESWNDVDLKLGTVTPHTSDSARLQPWKLSFKKAPNADISAGWGSNDRSLSYSEIGISRKAQVPHESRGLVFVIGKYQLDTQFTRVCSPRISTRVNIKAKVTNTSTYPLRPGTAALYMDHRYVSDTYISTTNSGDTFHLALGIDPNIQITYHPRTKEATSIDSASPFSPRPVLAYSCAQRITVVNQRDIPVSSLTIVDSIPTADDIDLFIKLINPPLKYPETVASGFKDLAVARTGTQVTENIPPSCSVFMRWDLVDEPPHDLSLLGTNGKINWVCSIAAKESVDLNLQWQVLAYSSKQIMDFD